MKQNLLYAAALTIMMALGTNGHAKSWRVNSNTTRGAHFADINAAMSSANVQDGDTLYLDPGTGITSQQNVTKRVTIIGPGFFHTAYPYGEAKISGQLYLRAEGIKVQGMVIGNTMYIGANNVSIERCLTASIAYSGDNCRNAVIRQCRINGRIYGAGKTLYNTGFWTIENCQIFFGDYCSIVSDLYSPIIRNNALVNTVNRDYKTLANIDNGEITNNYIKNVNKNALFDNLSSCTIMNNVLTCEETFEATYPGNKCINNNDETVCFTCEAKDLWFRPCENSPLLGYASDGGDCGPYGGAFPYVPGGMPLGIPYYTKAVVNGVAHDGKVNVSLTIGLQNE